MRRTKSHPAQCAALIAPCHARHAVSGRPWNSPLPRCGDPSLPQFVKDEFDAFLECGILAHDVLWVRCAGCGHEKLVAFSCKRRGICPSCGARRMAESAAWLVDRIIPKGPVRQWVLSFPIPLRSLFAVHPELLAPVLQIIHRVIATHLIRQAGVKRSEAATGAARGTFSGGLIRERGADGRARRALVPECGLRESGSGTGGDIRNYRWAHELHCRQGRIWGARKHPLTQKW